MRVIIYICVRWTKKRGGGWVALVDNRPMQGVCHPVGSDTAAHLASFREVLQTLPVGSEATIHTQHVASLMLASGLPTGLGAPLSMKLLTELIENRQLKVEYAPVPPGDEMWERTKMVGKTPPISPAAKQKPPVKEKMRVRSILGTLNKERGAHNEVLVLDSIHRLNPTWVRSARLATREEDRKGIDIVIDSIYGDLYLQVKSSRMGKERFLDTHTNAIECVVAVPLTHLLDRRVDGALQRLKYRVEQIRKVSV